MKVREVTACAALGAAMMMVPIGVASAAPGTDNPGKPGQFGQPPGQFVNGFAKQDGSVPSRLRDQRPPGSFVKDGFPPQGPCQAGCGGGA
jgi:hypothetical protein